MTRRRILAIIIALVIMCVSLVGCGVANEEVAPTNGRFVKVSDEFFDGPNAIVVFYDSETMVMYMTAGGKNHGFSPLYNADGTLMTYSTE